MPVLSLSGFHYSGIKKSMNFTSEPGKYFWSNGSSFGTCEVTGNEVCLEVLGGSLDLDELTLSGLKKPVATKVKLQEGSSARFSRSRL